MARCFAVNMIRTERVTSIEMVNVDTDDSYRLESMIPGKTYFIQLPEGTYQLSLVGTGVMIKGEISTGGVYGIFAHADLHDYRLAFDQVLPGIGIVHS